MKQKIYFYICIRDRSMYRLYLYTGWICLHKRSVSLIDMDYISERFVYSIELNTGYICTKDNIYTGYIYRYIRIYQFIYLLIYIHKVSLDWSFAKRTRKYCSALLGTRDMNIIFCKPSHFYSQSLQIIYQSTVIKEAIQLYNNIYII